MERGTEDPGEKLRPPAVPEVEMQKEIGLRLPHAWTGHATSSTWTCRRPWQGDLWLVRGVRKSEGKEEAGPRSVDWVTGFHGDQGHMES